MQHRTVSYSIDYLARDGRKRGQEACVLTVHHDGSRTLRSRSEIFEAEVLRDVVYTVDRDYRPMDALIRVSVKDRFVGSGWFRFTPTMAECESFTAAEGRLSQRVDLPEQAMSFISHAVSSDVWHGASIVKKPGLGAQKIGVMLSSSPKHNGSTGPALCWWPLQAHFLGVEKVETPAGVFDAEHIRYEELTGELFLDTWCTADGDRVMLKMYYPPYDSSYLLASYEATPGG
jgi:hypothetical protein